MHCRGLFGMAKRRVIVSKTNPDRYDENQSLGVSSYEHLIVFEMHLSELFIIET